MNTRLVFSQRESHTNGMGQRNCFVHCKLDNNPLLGNTFSRTAIKL
jgi:hypothetical protein